VRFTGLFKKKMKIKNNIIIIFLSATALFSCSKKPKEILPYTISKVFKTDSVTTVNARVNSRLTYMQLVAIAGKIKADSVKIQNMEVHYLLPGNADFSQGDNSYYASAKFLKEGQVKSTDTTQDYNGNALRVKIYGLSQDKVQKLLALQPKEITGQNVLGKFIDDYNHTVIIPFKNVLDEKNNLYVIELDSTAKVVSATVPQRAMEGNTEKWLVTPNGDYITIKDSILSQFSTEGLGLPFNSIKAGK
jgi:hypothetical protein